MAPKQKTNSHARHRRRKAQPPPKRPRASQELNTGQALHDQAQSRTPQRIEILRVRLLFFQRLQHNKRPFAVKRRASAGHQTRAGQNGDSKRSSSNNSSHDAAEAKW